MSSDLDSICLHQERNNVAGTTVIPPRKIGMNACFPGTSPFVIRGTQYIGTRIVARMMNKGPTAATADDVLLTLDMLSISSWKDLSDLVDDPKSMPNRRVLY